MKKMSEKNRRQSPAVRIKKRVRLILKMDYFLNSV